MKKSVRVTSKGQVTIPVEIRRELGLSEGQCVIFVLDNGSARMIPEVKRPLKEMKRLRERVRFSRKDVKLMLRESKESWERMK